MRSLNSDQNTLYSDSSTHLARLLDLVFPNGHAFHFTDCDIDLVVGATTYNSRVGLDLSSIETLLGTSPTSATVTLGIDGTTITRGMIEAGLMNNAAATMSVVDWSDLSVDPVVIYKGVVQSVAYKLGVATIDVESILSFDYTISPDKFQMTCRVDFGSTECGFDINSTKQNFTVTAITNAQVFTTDLTNADDFWNYGLAVFTDGNNNGIAVEVGTSLATGVITLRLLTPFALAIGDTGTMYQGCDKVLTGGCTTYGRILDFRGEPFVLATGTTTPQPTPAPTPPAPSPPVTPTVNTLTANPADYVYFPGSLCYVYKFSPGITLATIDGINAFYDYLDSKGITYGTRNLQIY